ncbi:MAG: hypothetical protein JWR85_361 [Marmoricola sp.]|nr:hypothetical protein [Marmoricola sp.]
MRALLVYESMFGNTEEIALAVAEGVGKEMEVVVREVSEAPSPGSPPVDLIVVGGPTHAFSLSRPSTRADAVKQGATPGKEGTGLRDWLTHLDDGPHVEKVACFDTRVAKARRLPGSAARKAVRLALGHGYASAGSESFWVEGTTGPLLPGELDRARDWGQRLASESRSRSERLEADV